VARPIKQGLEYFNVDTEWDRKMKLVRAKFQAEGIGIIILLWQWIYNEGYFTKWDEETKLIFAGDNHIDESKLDDVVLFAIEKEIFSKELYEKYTVLTSKGIQKRYLNSCLKRTEIRFHKNLLLIEPTLPDWSKAKLVISKNEIFPVSETDEEESKTSSKGSKSSIKDSKSTQRRESKEEKEEKGEERIESKETITPPTDSPSAHPPEAHSKNPNPPPEDCHLQTDQFGPDGKKQLSSEEVETEKRRQREALKKKYPEAFSGERGGPPW
jgi:hypothetical protein